MTIKKVTISQAMKSHPLAPAVLRQLGGGKDAVSSAMDAASHGADSGFGGFTYYADTIDFAWKNRKAIQEAVTQMADDLGEGTFTMIKGFRCLKDHDISEEAIGQAFWGHYKDAHGNVIDDVGDVLNALAWFALEEVGRAITDIAER